jgi:hypothetical protein
MMGLRDRRLQSYAAVLKYKSGKGAVFSILNKFLSFGKIKG